MPTDKPRFSITVDKTLSDAIDDYKYKTRSKNQTQAVVDLIEKGLNAIAAENKAKTESKQAEETKKSPEPEGSEEEKIQMVVSGLTGLLERAGWIEPGGDLTDAQLRTLASYVIGLSAYFDSGVKD